jgi:hypothetical protein
MKTPYWQAKTLDDLVQRYGKIEVTRSGRLEWPMGFKFLVPLALPKELALTNSINGRSMTTLFVNSDIVAPLNDTFRALIKAGLHSELKTFDGCFNPRYQRGSTSKPSLHSYAIALDFNASAMPLGSESTWSDEFVGVWRDHGWVWGGDWKRKDPQHFQFTNAG